MKKLSDVLTALLLVGFVAVFTYISVLGALEISDYTVKSLRRQTVTANVTKSDEFANNGVVSYNVYVSYTYNGTRYENVLMGSESEPYNFNEKLSVYVDTLHPDTVVPKRFKPTLFTVVSPIFYLGVSISVFYLALGFLKKKLASILITAGLLLTGSIVYLCLVKSFVLLIFSLVAFAVILLLNLIKKKSS